MNTRERIDKDFTGAVKAREAFVVSTLRMLRAALKNTEIDKRSTLIEEDVIDVLNKEIKKVKDSLDSFESAGREDLATKARQEIELLSKYQPEQLTDEEIAALVSQAIKENTSGKTLDFGQVMSVVMASVKGRADGGRVSKIVRQELSNTTP